MRPIIGVTTSISEDEAVLQLNRTYTDALLAAGAAPLLLPPTDSPGTPLSWRCARLCWTKARFRSWASAGDYRC